MRILLSFAFGLVVVVGSQAYEKTAAPAPENAPPLSIDGKYTLILISNDGVGVGPRVGVAPKGVAQGGAKAGKGVGGGGKGGAGGFPAAVARGPAFSALLTDATITKNEITLDGRAMTTALGGTAGTTTMEYTLDSTKTPASIDVETVNARGKKSKLLGRVEVIGNRLIIALAKEGDERPKTTEEAEDITVYYFQKAPPPPRTEFRIVAMTAGKEEAAEKELNKLAQDGFEFVSTTQPVAADAKSSVTTVHFLLKRIVK
jgi:hypothetical protein